MACSSDEVPNCRVAVVGDSGAGKTSLIHLLCYNNLPPNFVRTFGCRIDGKIHTHSRSGTRIFVEFLDVGAQRCHAKTRHMFYRSVGGVILLHDMTNRRSHARLRTWYNEIIAGYQETPREVCVVDREPVPPTVNVNMGYAEFSSGDILFKSPSSKLLPAPFPILIVGTHRDLLGGESKTENIFASEIGGERVEMNLTNPAEIRPGGDSGNVFYGFLDRVCDPVLKINHQSFGKNQHDGGQISFAGDTPQNVNLLHKFYPLSQQRDGSLSPRLRQRTSSFGPLSPKLPRSAAGLISSRLGTTPSCVVDSAMWHSPYAVPPLLQTTYASSVGTRNGVLQSGDATVEIF